MKKYGRDKPKEFPENFGSDLSLIHNSRLYFVEFQSVLIYYIGMYVNFRNFLLIYDLILHENEVFLLYFLLLLEGAIKEFVKGQLISKELFGFFNSSKKRTKNFCPNKLRQKLTFSSSFFGRIEDIKVSF